MPGAQRIADAYRQAVARLASAGFAEPARDIRLLLAHALDRPADRVMLAFDDPMPDAAQERFQHFLAARLAHQPVSKIIGRRQFWGRDFRVTPDVLDPRPETETLVAEALTAPFRRVLDLGTGSGAILLTLLAERPAATGLATDLSAAALDVAKGNAQMLGLQDRAAFAQGHWFAPVSGQFDLIVSNPPYITADEMAGLSADVLRWDPHLALTPGGDGLDAYRAIAAGTAAHLAPGGRILVEIGPTQASAVAALFAAGGLTGIRVLQDFDGRDRVVLALA